MSSKFEEIKSHLVDCGFEWNEPNFSKIRTETQVAIVNGHKMSRDIHLTQIIFYEGEGYVENENGSNRTPLYGFTFFIEVEGHKEGGSSVWVEDWQSFEEMIRLGN